MLSKKFLITHFSDLHLTKNNSYYRSEPKLFGKLRGMNKAFERLALSQHAKDSDLILFTGDITDTGHQEEWKFFWKTLDKNNLKSKSIIIPGNHDVCCLGVRRPKTARKRITEDLKKFHKGFEIGKFPLTKFPSGIPLNEKIIVFVIDSCNKGNTTAVTNAMGHLGYQQLERLARELYKYKDIKVKIVALHHSPNIPGKKAASKREIKEMSDVERWGMEMPKEDRRALRLLCVSHRVRLVLHGHLHRTEDRRVNAIRYIGAPASTQPNKGKFEFYNYEISASGGRITPKLVSIKNM